MSIHGSVGVAPFGIVLAAFLAAYNNLLNIRRPPLPLYIVLNVAVTAALVALGRTAGLSWAALGFAGWGRGLVIGLALAAVVAAAGSAASASPRLRPRLADRRVAGASPARIAFDVTVRIPLATVALEEVAFRGVLFGAWRTGVSTSAAVAVTSVVFGLWHIVPTADAVRTNRPAAGRGTVVAAVAGGVVATAVGGVGFALLRLAAGGILAPVLVHLAFNVTGTLVAYRAGRGVSVHPDGYRAANRNVPRHPGVMRGPEDDDQRELP